MCVGRTPEETLDIVMDALPTALGCDLIYLTLPGSPPRERATLSGAPVPDAQLAELARRDRRRRGRQRTPLVVLGRPALWCLEAEVPIGAERGRLLAGRRAPLEPETDRVLVRSAANVVGTTLAAANVLEVARRKDDFLAMLGHELRNPLAPIMTAVELLARNPSAAREQRRDRTPHPPPRAAGRRPARHLARHARPRRAAPRAGVAGVGAGARGGDRRPARGAPRHAFRSRPPTGVTLQGDPVRLAQIFANLLTNAAKFTPPGGKIDVLVERTGGPGGSGSPCATTAAASRPISSAASSSRSCRPIASATRSAAASASASRS